MLWVIFGSRTEKKEKKIFLPIPSLAIYAVFGKWGHPSRILSTNQIAGI